MSTLLSLTFDDAQLLRALTGAADDELDLLEFGLIGFDADGVVRAYNVYESKCAGLAADRVKNHPLFTVVAPCMNNFLVAQRFEDAAAATQPLDVTIDYVLLDQSWPLNGDAGGELRHARFSFGTGTVVLQSFAGAGLSSSSDLTKQALRAAEFEPRLLGSVVRDGR